MSSSCDCSEVQNPENFHGSIPKSGSEVNLKLKMNKMSVTGRKRNLGARIKVEFLDVQLNGAPFCYFFAKEGKADAVREAKRRKIEIPDDDADQKTAESIVSDDALKFPDGEFDVSQSNISDCGYSVSDQKSCADSKRFSDCGNSDKKRCAGNSNQASSSHSCESTVCSENSTDDVAPIAAIPLRMYHPDVHPVIPSAVEWTVKKTLTKSDCSEQHRLLIGNKLMETHFLPQLDDESRLQVCSPDGLRVDVLDCDVGVQVKLTLKKWPTANYYGLMDNWRRDFVNRRSLIPGDEVGLCWEQCRNRLLFEVLKRSPLINLNH